MILLKLRSTIIFVKYRIADVSFLDFFKKKSLFCIQTLKFRFLQFCAKYVKFIRNLRLQIPINEFAVVNCSCCHYSTLPNQSFWNIADISRMEYVFSVSLHTSSAVVVSYALGFRWNINSMGCLKNYFSRWNTSKNIYDLVESYVPTIILCTMFLKNGWFVI